MSEFSELQPWLQPYAQALVQYARQYGRVTVTSTLRSSSKQAQLYREYLAGRSSYPAAPPGTSYHEFGRAFDVSADPALLAWMGAVWEYWGGTYGAKFSDPIHFEA